MAINSGADFSRSTEDEARSAGATEVDGPYGRSLQIQIGNHTITKLLSTFKKSSSPAPAAAPSSPAPSSGGGGGGGASDGLAAAGPSGLAPTLTPAAAKDNLLGGGDSFSVPDVTPNYLPGTPGALRQGLGNRLYPSGQSALAGLRKAY